MGYSKRGGADEKESYGHGFLAFLLDRLVMRLHMFREREGAYRKGLTFYRLTLPNLHAYEENGRKAHPNNLDSN